jgi:hypothetical protein
MGRRLGLESRPRIVAETAASLSHGARYKIYPCPGASRCTGLQVRTGMSTSYALLRMSGSPRWREDRDGEDAPLIDNPEEHLQWQLQADATWAAQSIEAP